jgi:hypothetical protein
MTLNQMAAWLRTAMLESGSNLYIEPVSGNDHHFVYIDGDVNFKDLALRIVETFKIPCDPEPSP